MKDRKNKNHFEPRAKWIKTINLIMAARQHHKCHAFSLKSSRPSVGFMVKSDQLNPGLTNKQDPFII